MSTQLVSTTIETAAPAYAQDPELLADFLVEAQEHLAQIEEQALVLEANPEDRESVHALFRCFHSIKGLSAFLDLHRVRDLAHEVETILDLVREGQLALGEHAINVVLDAADYLRGAFTQLVAFQQSGSSPEWADAAELTAAVRSLASGDTQQAVKSSPSGGTIQRANGSATVHAVKVETAKLDLLVDMVGELVIAQSLVQHDPDLGLENRPRLARHLSVLSRITGELQKTAMSMRMVPVRGLFQRMTRLVRDLSRSTGKPAELVMVGEGTELDRNLVEELADPLLHMIRNSIDHGVEDSATRQRLGKSPVATIGLRACHQAGQVVIEVTDDGRGLDPDKILNKAIAKGIVAPGVSLSPADAMALIFEPGFSTAERVTEVSGRGVGMDVVRRQVQKLRGRIEIQSTLGQGTTFVLRLPLTLAILEGLVIGVGSERYILPLSAVRELLMASECAVTRLAEGAETVRVRGRSLPLVRLTTAFGLPPLHSGGILVVVEAETKTFVVPVDELVGKQQVVLKGLGQLVDQVRGVAAGAILGDGRVGLVLDVDRLVKQVGDA